MPRCLIIAGLNGAGKTTFARRFLPRDDVTRLVNADLLAARLSPLGPTAARVSAGKLFLRGFDRLAAARGPRLREHPERSRLCAGGVGI